MGLTAAMSTLNIPALSGVFEDVLELGGRIVLGAIIIGAGIFVANIISKIVTQTSGDLAGKIVKAVAIILFVVMGLNQMNLGDGIVETAVSYTHLTLPTTPYV